MWAATTRCLASKEEKDMPPDNSQKFIRGLMRAWRAEQASLRIYQALAEQEKNPARRKVLFKLSETEQQHAGRWAKRLAELGGQVPVYRETPGEAIWRWVLVQSGTDNALSRIESAEDDN